MEDTENSEINISEQIPFLVFTFVVGIGLVVALIVAGAFAWSFWISILIGALSQTIFRVTKRVWKNNLTQTTTSLEESEVKTPKHSLNAPNSFSLIFVLMVLVSAFWYSIGYAINWMFS